MCISYSQTGQQTTVPLPKPSINFIFWAVLSMKTQRKLLEGLSTVWSNSMATSYRICLLMDPHCFLMVLDFRLVLNRTHPDTPNTRCLNSRCSSAMATRFIWLFSHWRFPHKWKGTIESKRLTNWVRIYTRQWSRVDAKNWVHFFAFCKFKINSSSTNCCLIFLLTYTSLL